MQLLMNLGELTEESRGLRIEYGGVHFLNKYLSHNLNMKVLVLGTEKMTVKL